MFPSEGGQKHLVRDTKISGGCKMMIPGQSVSHVRSRTDR
jgi:hypothetical protein